MENKSLDDKRKRFDDLQQVVANGAQEDHIILLATTKKLDILGEVLLGNGHPEDSIVMQVRLLREWQQVINKVLVIIIAPMAVMFVSTVFGLLWLLLIHKATLIIH